MHDADFFAPHQGTETCQGSEGQAAMRNLIDPLASDEPDVAVPKRRLPWASHKDIGTRSQSTHGIVNMPWTAAMISARCNVQDAEPQPAGLLFPVSLGGPARGWPADTK